MKTHTVEIQADGGVRFDEKPIGKIVGYDVQDLSGASVVKVETDGALTLEGKLTSAKFDRSDALDWGDGSKMSVADDGVLSATKDGKPDPDRIEFVGFRPGARRTVLAVFVAVHLLNK